MTMTGTPHQERPAIPGGHVVQDAPGGGLENPDSQGMTVLRVEQFVTTALGVADRAAIMVHGRIQQEGSPREMALAAQNAYLT